MKINWNNRYATIAMYAFLVICASILLYLGISQINLIEASISDFIGTLQPFIIGGALAYLLNFILRFYEDYILSHKTFKKLKIISNYCCKYFSSIDAPIIPALFFSSAIF